MKDKIEKEAHFDSAIDKVWKAITDENEISSWFLEAEFKAEVGFQYTFTSSDESCSPIVGEVKSANPYILEYTWIEKGIDVVTTVRWTLTEEVQGTNLKLEHFGISNYEGENALKMFESFNGGWNHCVEGLRNHLSVYLNEA